MTTTTERKGGWIQTYTGRKFWPLDPRPEDIVVEDIAHALALTCRFTGHVREFYSVAQHSVLVSQNCQPEDALWGLLHDASEAYIADVSRPLKKEWAFREYRAAEARLEIAICNRFGLPLDKPMSIKAADDTLLTTEARDLMSPLAIGWIHRPEHGYQALAAKIQPVGPERAEVMFLNRFDELSRSAAQ